MEERFKPFLCDRDRAACVFFSFVPLLIEGNLVPEERYAKVIWLALLALMVAK